MFGPWDDKNERAVGRDVRRRAAAKKARQQSSGGGGNGDKPGCSWLGLILLSLPLLPLAAAVGWVWTVVG